MSTEDVPSRLTDGEVHKRRLGEALEALDPELGQLTQDEAMRLVLAARRSSVVTGG